MIRLAFVFSILLGTAFNSNPKQEDLARLIRALNNQMEDAYREGRLLDLAAMYHDYGHLIGPNNYHVTGREEIDKYWSGILEPIDWQLEVLKVSTSPTEILENPVWDSFEEKPPHWEEFDLKIPPDQHPVYQLGRSTLQYKSADVIRTSVVNFILVWTKEDNQTYKILIDSYH